MIKKIFNISKLPELLLLVVVLFYWISTSNLFNPLAIGLFTSLLLQYIFQNRIVGILLASILIFLSLYLILALLSELKEFQTFNWEAQKLLFVGLSFILFTISASSLSIYKYINTV